MPERRRYALAMISAVDDGVGQILQLLESRRIERQTLVVFVSDNGAPLKIDKKDLPITMRGGAWDGSLNDPWVGEKGMLTEGGIRVPFLLYWPGVLPAGLVYEEPVITLDIAATACALGGQEDSRGLDGVNLVPFLTGETTGAPHAALYWRFWGQAAIRCGPWKLLCLADGRRYLFDLDSPDHERQDVLGKHPETVARLTRQLEDWAAQLQPPGLPHGQLNTQEIAWYRHYLRSNTPD
jgi:arylsulfatase A-like enzyme